jgi:hypothetical protein
MAPHSGHRSGVPRRSYPHTRQHPDARRCALIALRFTRCNTNRPPTPIPPNHTVTSARFGRLMKFGSNQTSESTTMQKPITIVRIMPATWIICGFTLGDVAAGRLGPRFGRVSLGSVFAMASERDNGPPFNGRHRAGRFSVYQNARRGAGPMQRIAIPPRRAIVSNPTCERLLTVQFPKSRPHPPPLRLCTFASLRQKANRATTQ